MRTPGKLKVELDVDTTKFEAGMQQLARAARREARSMFVMRLRRRAELLGWALMGLVGVSAIAGAFLRPDLPTIGLMYLGALIAALCLVFGQGGGRR